MMRATTILLASLMVFVMSWGVHGTPALAQGDPGPDLPIEDIEQIKLTESQIKAFISAQPAVAKRTANVDVKTQKEEDKLVAALDKIVAEHGFKNFDEFDLVASNISFIMSGIDPETGKYTEPQVLMQRERREVEADEKIPPQEKRQLINEINEAIKKSKPIEHSDNIELVKKHREALEAAIR